MIVEIMYLNITQKNPLKNLRGFFYFYLKLKNL